MILRMKYIFPLPPKFRIDRDIKLRSLDQKTYGSLLNDLNPTHFALL